MKRQLRLVTSALGLSLGAFLGVAWEAPSQANAQPAPAKPAAAPVLKNSVIATPLVRTNLALLRTSPIFEPRLNQPGKPLRGFVDLHTHPMSHLGFGGHLIHGAPDVGILMPPGGIYDPRGVGISGATCNNEARPAASIQEALGTCYSTHRGHDLIKNKCGNHIREIVLSEMAKDYDPTIHQQEHPQGYPGFVKWPSHSDVMHQQMWIDWIKRAKEGGLRVMVALAVNNYTLATGIEANQPTDDLASGNLQIQQMHKLFENPRHRGWVEIAYSAADIRRIVGQDKLAVVLGVELDDIGNMMLNKLSPTPASVRAEVRRLHGSGVRYAFPIHLIDNTFGATAVYESEVARANRFHAGHWWDLTCSSGEGITRRVESGSDVFKLMKLGDAGGSQPLPNCKPNEGFKNKHGLSDLGRVVLSEMMSLGMLIDIDHMSQFSVADTLALTSATAGGAYPLTSGHNGLRGAQGSENGRTAAQYATLKQRQGMAGVGFGKSNAVDFRRNAEAVAATGVPIALGSDINGVVAMPFSPECAARACVEYGPKFPQAQMGARKWNYNTEGVVHVGLFPDFLKHVESLPQGAPVVDKLFDGAENFAKMWEKAETTAARIAAAAPKTFRNVVVTFKTADDDIRNGARAWITLNLRSRALPETEVTDYGKGAQAVRQMRIALPAESRVEDIASLTVRHFSNDCFACARDYWKVREIVLESDNGLPILTTGYFEIGHESKSFNRR